MDYIFLLVTILLTIFITKIIHRKISKRYRNLPPSPRISFPIIGHFHLLKSPLLHRTLVDLSASLGPIFSLRLGSRLAVVISSPAAAEECLLTSNDIVLANRPPLILGEYVAYDNTAMVTSPYGDHWRNLRKITSLEVFSSIRLNGSAEIRQDEVKRLLQKLYELSHERPTKVELRPLLTTLTLNVIMRMMTGKRPIDEENRDGKPEIGMDFRDLVSEILELSAANNPADFMPALKWFDYQGLVKRAKKISEKMDKMLQWFIDDHRANKDKLEYKNTMITHLLISQEKEPQYYTDVTIKGLMLMLVVGATDAAALTIEWAMANLLNHSHILKKLQEKIDTSMESSSSSRDLLKEVDLSNTKINYLNNVVSETLRLYPAAPLLFPHFSSKDCVIGGYNVPRDTTVLVNVWSIQRDPTVWEDPVLFKPERFEGREEGYSSNFLPFGLGRRACPGVAMGHRVVGLVLGSLVQCFDWETGLSEPVDMTEGPGISMPKAEPLVATCTPREMTSELLFGPNV